MASKKKEVHVITTNPDGSWKCSCGCELTKFTPKKPKPRATSG